MQPSSKEMQGVAANSHAALQELQSGGVAGHDDFLDQMMSGLAASWPPGLGSFKEAFGAGLSGNSAEDPPVDGEGIPYGLYDESSLLASRLRQHQAGVGGSPPRLLQLGQHGHHTDQQLMLLQSMGQPPAGGGGGGVGSGGSGGFLRFPLSLASGGSRDLGILADRSRGEVDASFKSPNSTEADALYHSGFGDSLQRAIQAPAPQLLHHHAQNYGGATPTAAGTGQVPTAAQAAVSASSGGGTAPPRPRVRARRGQATDPHSIAERLRREKIAERMKALQELVPNANKTDKASMLDEIIDYVKFLQLQVKVLSMSRLGAAGAVAPLVAGMSSEAGLGRAGGKGAVGNDGVAAAELQVAKLLEEDMGSAMQYLQGKGLCLMPISLASAISSSAVSHPRPAAAGGGLGRLNLRQASGDAPPSPSMSVLTVQSSNGGSADGDASRTSGSKDGTPVDKLNN